MTVLVFDEATHTYRVGGRRLPSVTEVLKPLYAGAFDFVTEEHLEWKSELGRAVHKACELDDDGVLDEESLDELVAGYVRGWRKFRAETPIDVYMNERPLHSLALGFAGTVDCVAFVTAPGGHRVPVLIDRKTVSALSPVIGVQLAGYEILVREAVRDSKLASLFNDIVRWAVQLTPDGHYHIQPYSNPDDKLAFHACLSLAHWKEKEK